MFQNGKASFQSVTNFGTTIKLARRKFNTTAVSMPLRSAGIPARFSDMPK